MGRKNREAISVSTTRADALKGGDENTNNIVPGDSSKSLLINYVARQVPDMEMPPAGKGEPLTPAANRPVACVGLIRVRSGARRTNSHKPS